MTRTSCRAATVLVLTMGGAVHAGGDAVQTVGPFDGQFSEDFEGVPAMFYSSLDIFISKPDFPGGEAHASLVPAFITTFSSFMGSTVLGHESAQYSHTTGPVEIFFNTPTRQFGGYFATNGGADGGTVEFFDDKGELISSTDLDVTFMTGIAPYTWNGWESDIAFSSIRIATNGALEGFMGLDDLQMTIIPAPGAGLLFLVWCVGGTRRRR